MKRILAVAVALFFSVSVFAARYESVEVEGLTEVQRAEVQKFIAVTKEQNSKKGSKELDVPYAPGTEKVNGWVDAGVSLGKGLAAAAKELGVAANEFVKTPVGKLTAAVVLYKFMGKDIIKLVSGFLFIVVFGSTWIYIFRRLCMIERIEYKQDVKEGKVIKEKQIIYGEQWRRTPDGTVGMFFITALLIPGIGLLIILA